MPSYPPAGLGNYFAGRQRQQTPQQPNYSSRAGTLGGDAEGTRLRQPPVTAQQMGVPSHGPLPTAEQLGWGPGPPAGTYAPPAPRSAPGVSYGPPAGGDMGPGGIPLYGLGDMGPGADPYGRYSAAPPNSVQYGQPQQQPPMQQAHGGGLTDFAGIAAGRVATPNYARSGEVQGPYGARVMPMSVSGGRPSDPNAGKASISIGQPSENAPGGIRGAEIRDEAYARQKMRRDEFRAKFGSDAPQSARMTREAQKASDRQARLAYQKSIKSGMSPRMAFAMTQSRAADGSFDFAKAAAMYGVNAATDMARIEATRNVEENRNKLTASEGDKERKVRTQMAQRANRTARRNVKVSEKGADRRAAEAATQRELDRQSQQEIARNQLQARERENAASYAASTGTPLPQANQEYGLPNPAPTGPQPMQATGTPLPRHFMDPQTGAPMEPHTMAQTAQAMGYDQNQITQLLRQSTGNQSASSNDPNGFGLDNIMSTLFLPSLLGENVRRRGSGQYPLLPSVPGMLQQYLGY